MKCQLEGFGRKRKWMNNRMQEEIGRMRIITIRLLTHNSMSIRKSLPLRLRNSRNKLGQHMLLLMATVRLLLGRRNSRRASSMLGMIFLLVSQKRKAKSRNGKNIRLRTIIHMMLLPLQLVQREWRAERRAERETERVQKSKKTVKNSKKRMKSSRWSVRESKEARINGIMSRLSNLRNGQNTTRGKRLNKRRVNWKRALVKSIRSMGIVILRQAVQRIMQHKRMAQ